MKKPTKRNSVGEMERLENEDTMYVDPYLFEIGFFKDREEYILFTRRAVAELRAGNNINPKVLR